MRQKGGTHTMTQKQIHPAQPAEKRVPTDPRISAEDLDFCSKCGREISRKWNYCPNCGKANCHQKNEGK